MTTDETSQPTTDDADDDTVPALEPFRDYVEIQEQCGGCGGAFDVDVPAAQLAFARALYRDWAKKHRDCLGVWRRRFEIGDG